MIIQILLSVIITILNAIFSWLPAVDKLPTIGGYDIDGALVGGMGMFWTFADAVWPVTDVFAGFLVLLAYYAIKMLLKLFLGHRAPGSH